MSEKILKQIKDQKIENIDLRFSDVQGKLHHITFHSSQINEEAFEKGVMFDGSSIAGWRNIDASDMIMRPDASTAVMDPFYQQETLTMICDIIEPQSNESYNRDPRSTAQKSEDYLHNSGIGDKAYFGPEAEFFVFDDVRWSTDPNNTSYAFDSTEDPRNSGTKYEGGNMGHRPSLKGGYFPVPPVDHEHDMRGEMLSVMSEMGLEPEKHHHEVAPAQHELGIKFSTIKKIADHLQLYKYIVQNVASAYGKTATFMPKPVAYDNGSGMHVHQSIWREGQPLFAGDVYEGLSQECLYYIGGIIKHAKAVNAFSNATTNSYKRLVPGYEAPVMLAYSARNRSASVRIPWVNSRNAKRLEVRFPDPAGNPYLTYAALLMAGLDGIKNKIDPGDPMDFDLYSLSKEEAKKIPQVATSLEDALENLDGDRDFLKAGDVFDDDQIDAYINLKMEDIKRVNMHPHPMEFELYYKC